MRQIPPCGQGHAKRHALVTQLLRAVIKLGDPRRDEKLVKTLVALETTLRPKDARGQATRHEVHELVAKFFGNGPLASRYHQQLRSDLRTRGMDRRLEAVDTNYRPSVA